MRTLKGRFCIFYKAAAVTFLLMLSMASIRGSAAPLAAIDTGIGAVMTLALAMSGNGWAWADAAPQKPGTRYLLRIEDGSWQVFSDSVSDPKLLPIGVEIRRIVLTADGKDGWAIGLAGEGTPIFWRLEAGAWNVATPNNVPASGVEPLSISITADGSDGWLTMRETATGNLLLFRLRSGAWTTVAQPEGGRLEMAGISPDGSSGLAVGSPRANSPQAIHKLANGQWAASIEILDRGAKATDIATDNEGRGWIIVGGTKLLQITADNKVVEAYTAEKDVILNGVAVDGGGRGWAVGWHDLGQQAEPGGIVFDREPVLVRLEGDKVTPGTAISAGFSPDDVGAVSLALSPGGAQMYAGIISRDGFGSVVHFHEPWLHALEGPSTAPPLSGGGQCFAEVPYCLRGEFFTFWQAHGGIDSMGLPITTEIYEELGNKTYRVQYTERARLEEHPENTGTPNEVLLGLLGNELADARAGEDPFKPVSNVAPLGPSARYYAETGHILNTPFVSYWDSNGGLPVYGYPRSEAFEEKNQADGKTYLVQYFERNRIEYHPENKGTKYEYLLGLLGVEHFTAIYGYKP